MKILLKLLAVLALVLAVACYPQTAQTVVPAASQDDAAICNLETAEHLKRIPAEGQKLKVGTVFFVITPGCVPLLVVVTETTEEYLADWRAQGIFVKVTSNGSWQFRDELVRLLFEIGPAVDGARFLKPGESSQVFIYVPVR